jgi:hypothetical protein
MELPEKAPDCSGFVHVWRRFDLSRTKKVTEQIANPAQTGKPEGAA